MCRLAALCLLGALGLGAYAVPALAYVPPLSEVYEQLVAGAPSADSAIIDLECRVYAPAQPGVPEAKPVVDPGRSFRQRVYWQRGKLLAVETLAQDGTLLHLYLYEAGFEKSAQISGTRRFSEADVRPLIYPILEGTTAAWKRELTFWGVSPTEADLDLLNENQTYRLTDTPDKALWLDPEVVRPLKLSTRVEGGAAPMLLTMEFSDFVSFASKGPEKENPRIPRKITYALDGKVFKDVLMTDFEVNPSARKFNISRWRQLVAAPAPESAPARPQ